MLTKNHIFPWGIYIGDLIDNNDTIPLCLDSKQGGFCLLFDEESEDTANNFIENVALKLFEVMPLGSIEVDVFDFGGQRFMKLSALKKLNLYNTSIRKNRASDRFDVLDDIEIDRLENILSFDTPTLSDYNKLNDETEKFYLLLMNLDDFPDEMSSPKRIKDFFKTAFNAGFYTIAFGSHNLFQSKSKATQIILNKFHDIDISKNQFTIPNELFGFDELLKTYEFEYVNDNKNRIIKHLLSQFEQKEQDDIKQDFLSVPIGDMGTAKLYFKMGLKSQNYSAFITGMTGSGKSNLINQIITEIAINYTVKEIELYLMDYNEGGLEFNKFIKHPNCKKLFLDCNGNPEIAYDMLEEFSGYMSQRGELLKSKGLSNIDSYNLKYPDNKLPYKVLIIDEVQDMFSDQWKSNNSFNALLTKIVKKGRKYGLHLILLTQELGSTSIDKAVINQMGLVVSLRLKKELEGMKIFNDKEAYNQVTKLLPYHLLYSSFGKLSKAKAIELKEDKIKHILDDIRNARKADEVVTPIVLQKQSKKKDKEKEVVEKKIIKEVSPPKFDTSGDKAFMELLKKAKQGGSYDN